MAVAEEGGRGGRRMASFTMSNGDNKDVASSLRSKPVLQLPVNLCQFQLKKKFYLWRDGINRDVVKKIVITSTSG
jgi:hypothetical protein